MTADRPRLLPGLRRTVLIWIVSDPGQWTCSGLASDLWSGGTGYGEDLPDVDRQVRRALDALRARGLVTACDRYGRRVYVPTEAGCGAVRPCRRG